MSDEKSAMLVAAELQRSAAELLVKAAQLRAEEYAGESTYARGRRHRRVTLLENKAGWYVAAFNQIIDKIGVPE